jgi:hypothetical protein
MAQLFTLLFFFTFPAHAKSLTCDVSSRDGLYAGGELTLTEDAGVEVKWLSPAAGEEVILGGSKVCGLETKAFRYPVACAASFTNPTPLRKMLSLCRAQAPDGSSSWVGSLQFVVKMENGEGQLTCRTSLGAYTDFRLDLKHCTER